MSSLRECLSHEHELLWCCSPTWDSSLKSAHSLRNLAAGWPMWGIPVLLQRGWKHWLELMTALRVNFDEKEGEIFQLIKNPPPPQSISCLPALVMQHPNPPPVDTSDKNARECSFTLCHSEVWTPWVLSGVCTPTPPGHFRAPACEMWQNSTHLPICPASGRAAFHFPRPRS